MSTIKIPLEKTLSVTFTVPVAISTYNLLFKAVVECHITSEFEEGYDELCDQWHRRYQTDIVEFIDIQCMGKNIIPGPTAFKTFKYGFDQLDVKIDKEMHQATLETIANIKNQFDWAYEFLETERSIFIKPRVL